MSMCRFVCVLFLAACGDDATPPAGADSGTSDRDGGDIGRDAGDLPITDAGPGGRDSSLPFDATAPGESVLSVDIGPVSASRGEENTVCVVKRLSLDRDVFVREVRTHVSAGSHHFILYRLESGAERPEPFPCTPFVDLLGTGSAPIVLAQEREGGIRFPDGTGLRLSAGQLVRLELHYINYVSDTPIDITGTADMHVTEAIGDLEEIDYIFSGTLAIDVAARSEGMAEKTYTPPAGMNLFAVTTHTHQWGTLSTVTLTNGDSRTELHRTTDWADPGLSISDPPLVFASGDRLRLSCQYFNGSDSRVRFGEGFNDEMCFMIGLYYPSRGFILDL
jgi:hypothetical protein